MEPHYKYAAPTALWLASVHAVLNWKWYNNASPPSALTKAPCPEVQTDRKNLPPETTNPRQSQIGGGKLEDNGYDSTRRRAKATLPNPNTPSASVEGSGTGVSDRTRLVSLAVAFMATVLIV